jgi:hypothetical protein
LSHFVGVTAVRPIALAASQSAGLRGVAQDVVVVVAEVVVVLIATLRQIHCRRCATAWGRS